MLGFSDWHLRIFSLSVSCSNKDTLPIVTSSSALCKEEQKNYYFLYMAQSHINSALTCIAFSTIMILNIINSRIWFNTKISSQTYIGGALGLIGIVTLFWPQIEHLSLSDKTLLGLGLCFIGTMCASAGNMISILNKNKQLPIVQSNAWGMMYGTLFMAIIAMVQGVEFTISTEPSYLISLFYLSNERKFLFNDDQ